MNEITPADLAKGRKLAIGAVTAPVALTLVPLIITLILTLIATGGPPAVALTLFFGLIATAAGFITGLVISIFLAQRRATWTREMRERIASDGIRAEEIAWFRNEIRSNEKRALRAVEARDLLLGDAYRETLASRLTATRIVRSSKRELLLTRKRQTSVKRLKSARAEQFQAEIARDLDKISKINDEAKLMLAEAEARLQMIEAAASREGAMADSEIALKKLSARSRELPLALESAKMSEEIRLELEKEDLDEA